MRAVVVVPISGGTGAWKVAEPSDPPETVQDREVILEIEGSVADGYHLVMNPAGCFTADTWHQSIDEAKQEAAEQFGVPSDGWTT